MENAQREPRLFLPILEPLYQHLIPISWLVIRCAAGVILFVHGYQKIGHADTVAANMLKNGIWPPLAVAYLITFVESFGAL